MDAGSASLMHARTWRWLSVRIIQLLTDPDTRLHRAIYPQKDGNGPQHR